MALKYKQKKPVGVIVEPGISMYGGKFRVVYSLGGVPVHGTLNTLEEARAWRAEKYLVSRQYDVDRLKYLTEKKQNELVYESTQKQRLNMPTGITLRGNTLSAKIMFNGCITRISQTIRVPIVTYSEALAALVFEKESIEQSELNRLKKG